ncbi:MAG: hypothetical protein ACYC3O_12725 [Burkholderiales bacterium]
MTGLEELAGIYPVSFSNHWYGTCNAECLERANPDHRADHYEKNNHYFVIGVVVLQNVA